MFDLPFWVGIVLVTFGLPLAAEFGFRAYGPLQRLNPSARGPADNRAAAQALAWGVALLSLLLAFTLSSAAARYEARRTTITQEADQISTTYLRVQLIAQPAKSRMSALLVQYARDREAMILAFEDVTERARLAKIVAADQKQLWIALAVSRHQRDSDLLKTKLLESMNNALSGSRFTYGALESKTASLIIALLVIFSFGLAFLAGYQLGASGKRYPVLSTGILIMYGWTMLVVNDLDHPGRGFIANGTGPFERALELIDSPDTVTPRPAAGEESPGAANATVSPPRSPPDHSDGAGARPASRRR